MLVVIDPVGLVPMFLALAGERDTLDRRRIARRAVLTSGGILVAFALVGSWVLARLQISLDAFRVAGGLLLFWIAVRMVFAEHERETKAEEAEAMGRQDISVFPLAIPIIAGPGALASVMILVGEAAEVPLGLVLVLAMTAVVLALCHVALRLSEWIARILGQTGVNVVTRVLGVLLAALAMAAAAGPAEAAVEGDQITVDLQPDFKWVQYPDLGETVLDVNATSTYILADDFQCGEPGIITNIRVWGSWLDDTAQLRNITLSIREDIPASQSPTGYSMPGELLWTRRFDAGSFGITTDATGLHAGWLNPPSDYSADRTHTCYQYSFDIPPERAFFQEGTGLQPEVYWLSVQAVPLELGPKYGWKTTAATWNDAAVWGVGMEPFNGSWTPLSVMGMAGPRPLHLAFAVQSEPVSLDFGDAPEVIGTPGYPTTLARNGARHRLDDVSPQTPEVVLRPVELSTTHLHESLGPSRPLLEFLESCRRRVHGLGRQPQSLRDVVQVRRLANREPEGRRHLIHRQALQLLPYVGVRPVMGESALLDGWIEDLKVPGSAVFPVRRIRRIRGNRPREPELLQANYGCAHAFPVLASRLAGVKAHIDALRGEQRAELRRTRGSPQRVQYLR